MRTALVLLLLLAIAAVPGSIVPQRSADPNGVAQYFADNPTLAPIIDGMQLFDVYSSAWFSAIYILLFVSLIGCVIPRTKHHWKALRARPPRTPARLSRLDDHRESIVELTADADAAASAATAISLAEAQLKRAGYRTERYDTAGSLSISAERGYLRETGNLVFHGALVGVLIAVAVGGGLTYTGQSVIIEGRTLRQHDARLRVVQPRTLRRRRQAHPVLADPRQVLGHVPAARCAAEPARPATSSPTSRPSSGERRRRRAKCG